MSLTPFQLYQAEHLFTADIFDRHPPGGVELVGFWKLGSENVARGPPNMIQRPMGRKTPRKAISGLTTSLRK